MNLGKNKNKIAIIGHTRGIGKAIADLYIDKKYNVIGMSRSNGFDLVHDQEKILEKIEDCDLVVLNAHSLQGQLTLLKRIYGRYSFNKRQVAVITSTSGLDDEPDLHQFKLWDKFEYSQYCEIKKELIEYISKLQEELLTRPLSVYDICPDVVDTDMTKGLWNNLPKLTAQEVADAVRYCFESTFNVNKIVLQKNAK